jgi:hypothetical protein
MAKGHERLGSVNDFAEQQGLDIETTTSAERAAAFAEYTHSLASLGVSIATEQGITPEELHRGTQTGDPSAEPSHDIAWHPV